VLDKKPQFVVELTKELNRMLGIETKLSTLFYSQTDSQMEKINQDLEQYLRFFIDHRQKNWPEWLVTAEFAVNNKTYSATKVSLFIVNYGRELRIRADIRRKGKVEKVTGFAERMKKGTGESRGGIKESIEVDEVTGRQEAKEWKKGDRVILNTKNLVFKERLVKKLVD